MSKPSQKSYWEEELSGWDQVTYGKGPAASPLQILLGFFGRYNVERQAIAERFLREKVRENRILDIGCGSGDLLFLLQPHDMSRGMGIDIVADAAARASERAAQQGLDKILTFQAGSISEKLSLIDEADIIVGLGIFEYISRDDLTAILTRIQAKKFFFQFHESRISLINLLHFFFRKFKRLPSYSQYSRTEIETMFRHHGIDDFHIHMRGPGLYIYKL